jgi:hypothetical protein
MLNNNKRFSSLEEASIAAIVVANVLEANVPIYANYADPTEYYLWNGDEFIEWVKPSLLESNDY